ncbi:MAG: hypothetical protein HRT69_13850 [Flavobacteriaceae bacterium]|nr:hypothetical protein [Flavobacteriaceae bacterium]
MKSTVTDISKRIELKVNKTEGIINYDIDNAYPQRVVDIINASGTGVSVTEKFSKFIFGGGFVDENLAKFVVNSKGMTANDLLRKVSNSLSKFNGLTIHANYDANLNITSLSNSPFEYARFTTPENEDNPNVLAIYNDWQKTKSTRINKKNIDFINFYDPNKVQDQVDAIGGWHLYKGQIMYWTFDGIEYPLAPSDSVLEDVQTDYKCKNFKLKNVSTNFLASYIFEVDAFENEADREEFVNNLTNFQGDDNALRIFLLEKIAGQTESGFKMQKVDIQDVNELYKYTEISAQENTINKYGIPTVLMKSVAGKLGSSSEIKDATAQYNGHTLDYRIALEEIFTKLMSRFVGANFTDFSIKEMVAATVPVKNTAEGKAKIVEVLTNSSLSVKQKKGVLKTVYELTDSEIEGLEIEEDVNLIVE